MENLKMERLIEMVRENPALYDPYHAEYMRTKLKDEIWSRIAKELKYPKGDTAREQWRKLRDCHRDALRRQKKKRSSDGGGSIGKQWIYQKQMEFLLPYMTSRSCDLTDCEPLDEIPEVDKSEVAIDCLGGQNDNECDQSMGNDFPDQMSSYDEYMVVKNEIEEMKKRSFFRKDVLPQEDDPLFQFFMSMYNTTKRMPVASQLKIKKQVFVAVSSEEEEMINHLQQFLDPCTTTVALPSGLTFETSN